MNPYDPSINQESILTFQASGPQSTGRVNEEVSEPSQVRDSSPQDIVSSSYRNDQVPMLSALDLDWSLRLFACRLRRFETPDDLRF